MCSDYPMSSLAAARARERFRDESGYENLASTVPAAEVRPGETGVVAGANHGPAT
ncbi:hypothetical protein SAMN04487905_101151 [Actinopolyspora xinjiangensis]|uniref:Uncharacterized protein n=1 Tax=Actinopolyspora xinjiangensis TaxID=405564 RepID=A0A1H0NKD7_9ACTN|nr:hypothetical protein [Actinopolyspora xinjiangensis]SDO92800.1 hypothetical protein SAMN04487905_101151 [Actinopolyspora xinjiangensis]